MKRFRHFVMIVGCSLLVLSLSSCKKKTGCMDPSASNYNSEANKDCSCCQFERVVFFSRYPAYVVGGVTYSISTYPIKVFVGTQEVGTISAVYPNGPGNPNVPGTVVFSPGTTKSVEWFAKVTAPNGNYVILGSGTFNAGKSVYYVPIF